MLRFALAAFESSEAGGVGVDPVVDHLDAPRSFLRREPTTIRGFATHVGVGRVIRGCRSHRTIDVTPTQLLDRMGAPLAASTYDWDSGRRRATLTAEERFQLTYATHVEWGTEDALRQPRRLGRPARRPLPRHLAGAGGRAQRSCSPRSSPTQGEPVALLHRTRSQRLAARRGRWVNQAAAKALGSDFFAVHMTWGAVKQPHHAALLLAVPATVAQSRVAPAPG